MSLENFIICIPTHKRENEKEQRTIKWLPESLYDKVYFFTDETRADLLKHIVPAKCNIVPVPQELGIKGIAGKRQFIVEWANRNGFQKIWQIDDSVDLCENVGLHPTLQAGPQLLRIKEKDKLIPLLQEMSNLLDDYPLAGHLNRSGTYQQRIKSPNVYEHQENKRMYTSLGINTKFFVENDIRFDYLQNKYGDDSLSLMEDYTVQLQLLTKGFKTIQIGTWCFDKASFSGKGGCADERNIERQKNVCDKLHETFPDYVKVVEAKDETKKESVKYNVQISWKKLSDIGKVPEVSKQSEQSKEPAKVIDEW